MILLVSWSVSALIMNEQGSIPSPPEPSKSALNKAKHIKYWLRCLKTHLPTGYSGNDSQRMTLAFFTLSALDILGELQTHTTDVDRQSYVDWVYRCQHPNGGFKGFTGADGGLEMRNGPGQYWDPANLAATFFALAILIVLDDSMEHVEVKKCLLWLKSLQRPDGSFGEAVGKGGRIEGIVDTRHCYLAACVRWILRRGEITNSVDDIDVDRLTSFVEQCIVSPRLRKTTGLNIDENRPTTAGLLRRRSMKPMVRKSLYSLLGERAYAHRQMQLD